MQDAIQGLVNVYRQQHEATLKVLFITATSLRYSEDMFEDDEIFDVASNPPPTGGPFLTI
jgi:hypothetical protein